MKPIKITTARAAEAAACNVYVAADVQLTHI